MRARILLLVLPAVAALLVAPGLARGEGRQRPVAVVTYTVQPGDTLWSIARRVAPDRDPRPVVDGLVDANHLRGSLQVGQRLTVVLPGR